MVKSGRASDAAAFLLLVVVALMVGFGVILPKQGSRSTAPVQESRGSTVLRDLAAGRPVPMNEFEAAFSRQRSNLSIEINRVAEDLGIKFEDARDMVLSSNLSIVYTGPQDKIPAKLKLVSVSASE